MNNKKTKILFCMKTARNIKILSSIESIGDYCFRGSNVETVEIENNSKLERIGRSAFFIANNYNLLKFHQMLKVLETIVFQEVMLKQLKLKIIPNLKELENMHLEIAKN